MRSASVLALGPLCRRSAPGVDRLQLHDRGHLPDRQSRAASHSRPHAGRRREGRARAQNCKDNEELHEYLDRVDRGVSPRSNDGGRDRRRFTKVIEEVRGGSRSQRPVCFPSHPTVAWLTHPAHGGDGGCKRTPALVSTFCRSKQRRAAAAAAAAASRHKALHEGDQRASSGHGARLWPADEGERLPTRGWPVPGRLGKVLRERQERWRPAASAHLWRRQREVLRDLQAALPAGTARQTARARYRRPGPVVGHRRLATMRHENTGAQACAGGG